ncbi:MAG: FAD-dependent monooxygenase [Oscillospiraceae bacterium]|jgi:flavin-dependent dehydrogenase|nr:FAD-dependent monooxygenase [Oscillospiraceae bacterium]
MANSETLTYDVLVIGAGTAGCYFAHEMAVKGHKVLVVDRDSEEELGQRLRTLHVDWEMFHKLGIPMPRVGDEDFYNFFYDGSYYSPKSQYKKRKAGTECIKYAYYPFLVTGLPPLLKRMRKWCTDAGVAFALSTEFTGFRYDEYSRIAGGFCRRLTDGSVLEVAARLTADCSGLEAAGRIRMHSRSCIDRLPVAQEDKMFVVLNFLKLKNPEEDAPVRAEHWAYYKAWIGQSMERDECIIGTGANISYAYAEECYERFKQAVELPEGEYIRQERGEIPYRRAPYALADDGFVVMGDAACMNKWVGEGVCSGWVGARMAADVADKAMKHDKYPTREALWEYCVRYNRSQAADFSYIMATLINSVDCTEEEMEYEFRHEIVFNDKAMTRLNREYNAELPPAEAVELVGKMVGGVLTKNISLGTAKNLVKGVSFATLLKAHYRRFPKTYAGYAKWAAAADKLWTACGTMYDATICIEKRVERKKEAAMKEETPIEATVA